MAPSYTPAGSSSGATPGQQGSDNRTRSGSTRLFLISAVVTPRVIGRADGWREDAGRARIIEALSRVAHKAQMDLQDNRTRLQLDLVKAGEDEAKKAAAHSAAETREAAITKSCNEKRAALNQELQALKPGNTY